MKTEIRLHVSFQTRHRTQYRHRASCRQRVAKCGGRFECGSSSITNYMLQQQTVLVDETRGSLINEEAGPLKVRGELGCWSQWHHGFTLAANVAAEKEGNTLIFPSWIRHDACVTCAKQDTSSLHALTDTLWDETLHINCVHRNALHMSQVMHFVSLWVARRVDDEGHRPHCCACKRCWDAPFAISSFPPGK